MNKYKINEILQVKIKYESKIIVAGMRYHFFQHKQTINSITKYNFMMIIMLLIADFTSLKCSLKW